MVGGEGGVHLPHPCFTRGDILLIFSPTEELIYTCLHSDIGASFINGGHMRGRRVAVGEAMLVSWWREKAKLVASCSAS